ncbi:uncharacterized protein V6R79_026429 [Siganus canaliculatus]
MKMIMMEIRMTMKTMTMMMRSHILLFVMTTDKVLSSRVKGRTQQFVAPRAKHQRHGWRRRIAADPAVRRLLMTLSEQIKLWMINLDTESMHAVGFSRVSLTLKAFISCLVLPKPGHCPRLLNVVPSHKGCVCDEDCPSNHKCCVFDCGAVCVPPAFTKPGVCPRRTSLGVGLCAEFCSNDSDCPDNEKCCSNGCGHQCTAPHKVKPGRCPLPKGTPMCAEYCYHDGQCPAEQKCCRTTCGHACSEPC